MLSRRVYTEMGLQRRLVRSKQQLADESVTVSDTFDTSLKVLGVNKEVSFSLEDARIKNAVHRFNGSVLSQSELVLNEHLADINIPAFHLKC